MIVVWICVWVIVLMLNVLVSVIGVLSVLSLLICMSLMFLLKLLIMVVFVGILLWYMLFGCGFMMVMFVCMLLVFSV